MARLTTFLFFVFLSFHAFDVAAELDQERWCKVSTSEFELFGYLPKGRLQSLADSLLAFNYVTEQFMPGDRIEGHQLRVVAFRNRKEFLDVFRQEKFIGFMHPSLRQHLLAFVIEEKTGHPLNVAFHEYTHFLARSRLNTYVPLWYEEGFAQFMSTIQLKRNTAIVGEIPRRRLSNAVRRNSVNIQKILNSTPPFDWGSHDPTENYLVAWAITHLLFRGVDAHDQSMRERIPDLLQMMSSGMEANEALMAFTGTDQKSLIALIRSHLGKTAIHEEVTHIERQRQPFSLPVSCLNRTESKVLLGEVLTNNNPELAIEYLESARLDTPNDPDLLVALSRAHAADYQKSYELALRAYETDKSNVNANVRLADLLTWPCLIQTGDHCSNYLSLAARSYNEALKHAPKRVDAAFGLGVVYLETGRAGDGLNYLRVAHQRAPWSPRTNLFLGDAYRLIGNDRMAEEYLTKAVLWESQDVWRKRAAELLASVQDRTTTN